LYAALAFGRPDCVLASHLTVGGVSGGNEGQSKLMRLATSLRL